MQTTHTTPARRKPAARRVSRRKWWLPLGVIAASAVIAGTAIDRPTYRVDAGRVDSDRGAVAVVPDAPTAEEASDLVAGIEARAYAVYDPSSGEFLAARDLHGRRPVASLMKLLTAWVAMEAGEPDRVVRIPPLHLQRDESRIGLIEGEELRRDVLLRATLIASANDAARALAIDIAGNIPSFVERMNAAANELGLHHTHAVDPAGLDAAGQYSSARDLVVLADVLMRDADFRATVARREARLHGEEHPATNDLLGTYLGADGVKTGHTDDAGWCLLASATRDDRRLYAIVLGAPTEEARDRDATRLLDWGFAMRGSDEMLRAGG